MLLLRLMLLMCPTLRKLVVTPSKFRPLTKGKLFPSVRVRRDQVWAELFLERGKVSREFLSGDDE